jgi:hypothetical protein
VTSATAGRRPASHRRGSHRRAHHRRTAWAGAVLVVVAATVAGVVLLARPAVNRLLSPASCTVTAPSGTFTVTVSQARYAATIAAVGERDGMPDHAVSVALATALQESKLADLDYGDRDSLGLFQQRPSQGWGTPSQVMDPVYSANAFYQALAKVPDWQDVSVTAAAQDVQRSNDPGAYEQWASEGRALGEAFTGEAPAALACSYRPAAVGRATATAASLGGGGVPSGADPAAASEVAAAVTDELGGPLPDQTVATTKDGWRLASWLVARGDGFGVSEVRFDGWLWTARTGRWSASAVPAVDQVTYTIAATPS